jgi:hypothetical protein
LSFIVLEGLAARSSSFNGVFIAKLDQRPRVLCITIAHG